MKANFYLLSRIQKAQNSGFNMLVVKKLTDHTSLLRKLVDLGLIKSYKQSTSLVFVHLVFSPVKVHFNQTAACSTSSKKLTKNLIRVGGSSYSIIQTDLGILVDAEAAKYHIGGKILASFN